MVAIKNITVEVLKDHLFVNVIDKGYIRWIWQGESTRDRPINPNDRRCDKREKINCSESDK